MSASTKIHVFSRARPRCDAFHAINIFFPRNEMSKWVMEIVSVPIASTIFCNAHEEKVPCISSAWKFKTMDGSDW